MKAKNIHHDLSCRCDRCYDHDHFALPSYLDAGVLVSDSEVVVSLIDGANGDYGSVDLAAHPYDVQINKNVLPYRRSLSLIHELFHIVDEEASLQLAHEMLHCISCFLYGEVFQRTTWTTPLGASSWLDLRAGAGPSLSLNSVPFSCLVRPNQLFEDALVCAISVLNHLFKLGWTTEQETFITSRLFYLLKRTYSALDIET